MAEEMDFESFDKMDDLDWSELEGQIKKEQDTGKAAPAPKAAGAAPAAAAADANAAPVSAGKSAIDIGYLLDVNLHVTVEVGRKPVYISSVLGYDHGSIIELDKLVGEPLNLLVNGKPVAKGEVVIVNEKFALKIIEIMDPQERLHYLQA
ncbi:MAG: flagellar motor switch protein FliN [Candidatus Lambdaproteobacteria bacterium]|nr:flagellar motor switch protein FliN [Candidatus Lambdaproteobacteria bacterium]